MKLSSLIMKFSWELIWGAIFKVKTLRKMQKIHQKNTQAIYTKGHCNLCCNALYLFFTPIIIYKE